MSDKDREYEEIMKLFEQKYPESTNSDRQRQPQSRYSADCPVSQRTPQQRTATAQPSRQTVNNRTYTRQHIPQKRRTAQKRRQRRLFGASAAVLAIALLVVIIIVIARSCSVGGNVLNGGSVPNGTDVLNGTWNLDGITVYQFDGKGNGSLNASLSRLRSHLPSSGCKRHSLLAMCSKSNQQDRLCLAQS